MKYTPTKKSLLLQGIVLGIFFIAYLVVSIIGKLTPSSYYDAVVTAIKDGDTIVVEFSSSIPTGCTNSETIRLIGVNSPELKSNEYYAVEAAKYTNNLLYKQPIKISITKQLRDVYGRVLAYVYLNGNDYNNLLILNGYAKYYDKYEFSEAKMNIYSISEAKAKQNLSGMWNNLVTE